MRLLTSERDMHYPVVVPYALCIAHNLMSLGRFQIYTNNILTQDVVSTQSGPKFFMNTFLVPLGPRSLW